MTCPACGKPIHPEDRFCAACGAALAQAEELDQTGAITAIPGSGPATGTGPAAALGSGIHRELPTGSALLVVHRGPAEGSEFLLPADADVVGVGRSPESDVFLDDVTVSRRHAEFRRGADGWSVRDVGSLNGTYVNRVRVDDQRLAGGDEVQIGKFRFVFLVGVEPGA
jgi:pSer/pThr/pTyr-binding forkhead associated (FHA) protein